jgi:hypothetical protein
LATATLRLGPADIGRALTLVEFLDAEVEPGYRYELARGGPRSDRGIDFATRYPRSVSIEETPTETTRLNKRTYDSHYLWNKKWWQPKDLLPMHCPIRYDERTIC